MQKFENVDVLAALEQIMRQHTAFYQNDFDIDKDIIANPAEPVNGQDERAAPAVDSPARFCSWAVKARQPKVLPHLTIIKGNYPTSHRQPAAYN